jgi:hypothetical protein
VSRFRLNHHRRDESHREIVATLERLGCSVRDLSQVGDKGADLDVGVMGLMYAVECKSGKESLSAEQIEFYLAWRGPPVVVLHDADEATAWVSGLRRRLFKAHEED